MEQEYNIESSNIHFKWLDNIFNQLMKIQEMEVLALEGCASLAEYIEMPQELKLLLLPEIQYKNLRFLVREINILIDNLAPILKDQTENYKDKIKCALTYIDKRSLFLKDLKRNNQVVQITVLPFFRRTLEYILLIKSELIKEQSIMPILYLDEEVKKKW